MNTKYVFSIFMLFAMLSISAQMVLAEPSSPVSIDIDISPNQDPNVIYPERDDKKNIVYVSALTTTSFDAATIDPATVEFGPDRAKAIKSFGITKDVDFDGDVDITFRFRVPETGIQCGENLATLYAMTYDGVIVSGSDVIQTDGCEPQPQIDDLLGDMDGFGYGLVEGEHRSVGAFDNREPEDPFFTDMWGVSSFSYVHSFDIPADPIENIEFRWFISGMQDGDDQVVGSDVETKLYLDGIEVPYAFDQVDQFDYFADTGWSEIAGTVRIVIPEELYSVFMDGSVEVRFETLALGSFQGLDAFAIDYSHLIIY